MNLVAQLIQRIDNPACNYSERVRFRCALAREFEEAGSYEAARNALGDLWTRVGERPALGDLDERTGAEVLLRVGALSGWIGSARQIEGAQEIAKDLISESLTIYETLSETAKTIEARSDLALCYWREGAFDEARIILRDALGQTGDDESELKALILLRSSIIEMSNNRLNDALRLLTEASPLFEASTSCALKGKFHNSLGNTLETLGVAEARSEYTDQALIEYAAASYHFEQAGHTRYRARVENNIGYLLLRVGQLSDAEEHLERAHRLFIGLKDKGSAAQVDETRARVLLVEGRNSAAEKAARGAVNSLEKGGEQALLAEALTTYAVALARLNRHQQAQATLERAVDMAETAGDIEGAGRATLTLIEELDGWLAADELRKTYERADRLLTDSRHGETLARLRACARRIIALDTSSASGKASEVSAFVHASEKTTAVLHYARAVAITDRPALITGETGSGKEVLARLMHEWSGRAGRFVAINCAALCETLIESQLFGHRKGSFTDAVGDHTGVVRGAVGGTLFLDEVGELSAAAQAKLLRLIEYGEVTSLGASASEQVDIRIIAATNHNLKQDMARGHYSPDLYYRLSAFIIELPPLRQRTEDIPAIARHFIAQAERQYHKQVTFAPACLDAMQRLHLAGNARELRTLIERTFLTAADNTEIPAAAVETLALRQVQTSGFASPWAGCSLDEEVLRFEANLIRSALEVADGQLTRAARLLGITHQGLSFILNGRHKELRDARRPPQRRRVSIIRGEKHRERNALHKTKQAGQ